ncbi:MAG: acyltransferase [Pseudonocardiales bacterium]|nr:acyltransferase [Pseudonocardiales bacterium]MBV9030520.1 acyltransferase [Pseudonocardiales bacterium]
MTRPSTETRPDTRTRPDTPATRVSGPGHVYAVDLVRVLTFASVIAVHTVATVNPPDSVPAGGATMLLHFTREAFFALTAFVLVHRYRDGLHVVPFWRRRFLLVGAPYVFWSVIYSGLALITAPPPTETLSGALAQLGRSLLTGAAWYHLYFLVVMMQFYLLFPLFRWLLRAAAGKRGRHHRLLAISAVLQVGIDAGLHFAHPSGIAAELMSHAFSFVGSYVFYLVLGGVAALHAEEVQAWVRRHPATVLVVFVLTGAAAEGWYLRSVRGGSSPAYAYDVFQPVMVPWCVAVMTALFALGVSWAARRGAGPGSRAVEISSDRSFGVFLVHPMVLWTLTLGPAAWLSTRVSALCSTVIAFAATVSVSLLVVEVLRHSPLSMVLTGKRRSPRGRAVRSRRFESSASAPPIRLGAGRT